MSGPLTDEVLRAAVLQALRPRSPRERVKLWLSGGWTRAQLLARLSADVRAGVPDDEAMRTLLFSFVASGQVCIKQVRGTLVVNTQGPRDLLVDVYRLV